MAIAAVVVQTVMITNWPLWVKIALSLIVAVLAVVAIDQRLASRWLKLAVRNRRPAQMPTIAGEQVGCIALPGEDVALRWEGDELVALIALHPNPFTPTIVVGGRTIHDDCVDSALVEKLLARSGPEFSADIVSAGWRVARSAASAVSGQYEQMIGTDPCPAFRRSWILVRVDPVALPMSTTFWRGGGLRGAANALVSAATRLAMGLSGAGVDARLAPNFKSYIELTGVGAVQRSWTTLRQPGSCTTVFSAPGGPDSWWSERADRTVARLRVQTGQAPRSVVALTTSRPIERDPDGWIRLRGTQFEALRGFTPVRDVHHEIPVGSAGILVGQTVPSAAAPTPAPVYVPFDGAEAALDVSDPALLLQFAFRAAAAGAGVCLPRGYEAQAAALNAPVDGYAVVHWPDPVGRTWLAGRTDVKQSVLLSVRRIVLPRGRGAAVDDEKLSFAIQPINGAEDAVLGLRSPVQSGR
ncbi:ESX-1 secretion system protein EccE1 [Mycobacteroides salmoniphilum]|uniref:ESX-1 secretion system protein EccE1 n=2 Tax=Mycobacteroides salmoniphilum TaxID=404941 RepID=A0A4R8SZZ3_9MYCO|nr:ESX-1 secretion system protein EccE1 [Mycobacteroides salmoniphilum]